MTLGKESKQVPEAAPRWPQQGSACLRLRLRKKQEAAAEKDSLETLLAMRAEVQGPKETSRPLRGGASAISVQVGIPPAISTWQEADPGRGPAILGAEHGGSSKGTGIMTRAELQGPNEMSHLILGEESTVSGEATIPPEKAVQRGADPSRGPAALPGAGPGSTPYQEGKRNARHLTNACRAAQQAQ